MGKLGSNHNTKALEGILSPPTRISSNHGQKECCGCCCLYSKTLQVASHINTLVSGMAFILDYHRCTYKWCYSRGYKTRLTYNALKRIHRIREEQRKRRRDKRLESACRCIQRFTRGHLARVCVKKILEDKVQREQKELAAVIIQRNYRLYRVKPMHLQSIEKPLTVIEVSTAGEESTSTQEEPPQQTVNR